MARERELRVKIIGDASSAQSAFKKLGQESGQFSSKMAGFSSKMGSVGKTLTRTLTPAAVGFGAFALHAFNESDTALDTLRASTGATGKELNRLENSFANVAGKVSAPLSHVGEVMAELAKRTDLTGHSLEALTKRFLDLERMGQQASVETVTRVFGDWSISTGKQTEALDALFVASQKTGPSIDAIGQLIVKYGAPLRQLGFGFEESAALLGKFEKEGVNTQLVLGSLRIALGNIAVAGEPVIETFQRAVEEIQNAGSTSEANTKAIELFGKRAGPDMAAAITEGRFELGRLVQQVKDSQGATESAAKATLDWTDKLLMLRNRAQAIVGPVGEMGFAISGVAAGVGPAATGVSKFTKNLGKNAATMGKFGAIAAVSAGAIYTWSKAIHAADVAAQRQHKNVLASVDLIEAYGNAAEAGKHTFDDLYDAITAQATAAYEAGASQEELNEIEIAGIKALHDYNMAQRGASEETDKFKEKVKRATEVVSRFGMTRADLKTWKAALETDFESVGDSLSTLAGKAHVSADDILDSFKKQLNAIHNYEDNLRKLRKEGLPAGLEKQLLDMGLGGAKILEALAGATDDMRQDIFKDFRRLGGAFDLFERQGRGAVDGFRDSTLNALDTWKEFVSWVERGAIPPQGAFSFVPESGPGSPRGGGGNGRGRGRGGGGTSVPTHPQPAGTVNVYVNGKRIQKQDLRNGVLLGTGT